MPNYNISGTERGAAAQSFYEGRTTEEAHYKTCMQLGWGPVLSRSFTDQIKAAKAAAYANASKGE